MAPKPYDKFHALSLYCKEQGYSHDEVVYIGDDYGLGGNDESVYKTRPLQNRKSLVFLFFNEGAECRQILFASDFYVVDAAFDEVNFIAKII